MKNTGRFETTTKLKIDTSHGKILKLTTYPIDEYPIEDYKIRPKCKYCDRDVGCICYNSDNSDDPLEEAKDALQKEWVCESVDCIYLGLKENNEELYNELKDMYGDCKEPIVEYLQEICDDESDIFCLA